MNQESVIDRMLVSSRVADTARLQNRERPSLEREWEVFRAVGQKVIVKSLLESTLFQKKYDYSEEELVEKWNVFVDESLKVAQAILGDLGIESPDEVFIDEFSEKSFKNIASMAEKKDGSRILSFSYIPLLTFFLRNISNKESLGFQTRAAWYEFQASLAHEFRNLHQFIKYPSVSDKNQTKAYNQRLTEYDARLYSLMWLRKVKPSDMSDRMGLWLARTAVLIEKLHPFEAVRDRVHDKFGVRKPSVLDGVRMITTSKQ